MREALHRALLLAGVAAFVWLCSESVWAAAIPAALGAYWALLDVLWTRHAAPSASATLPECRATAVAPAALSDLGPALSASASASASASESGAMTLIALSAPPSPAQVAALFKTMASGPSAESVDDAALAEDAAASGPASRWEFSPDAVMAAQFLEEVPDHDELQRGPEAAPARERSDFERDFAAWLASSQPGALPQAVC